MWVCIWTGAGWLKTWFSAARTPRAADPAVGVPWPLAEQVDLRVLATPAWRGADRLARRHGLPVYATAGTLAGVGLSEEAAAAVRVIRSGEPFDDRRASDQLTRPTSALPFVGSMRWHWR